MSSSDADVKAVLGLHAATLRPDAMEHVERLLSPELKQLSPALLPSVVAAKLAEPSMALFLRPAHALGSVGYYADLVRVSNQQPWGLDPRQGKGPAPQGPGYQSEFQPSSIEEMHSGKPLPPPPSPGAVQAASMQSHIQRNHVGQTADTAGKRDPVTGAYAAFGLAPPKK